MYYPLWRYNHKGIVHSKMKILSSCYLSCFLKPIWLPFFCQTQKQLFIARSKLLFSIQWKWIMTTKKDFQGMKLLVISVCSSHKISIYLVYFYYGRFFRAWQFLVPIHFHCTEQSSMDIPQNISFLILRKKENVRVWNGTRVSKWLWW